MRVQDIMTREVTTCEATDSLQRAAQLMWEQDCGALPVRAGDSASPRIIGMITDRDICMAALFRSQPLAELRVADTMSRDPRVCHPQDSLAAAEELLREARLRRLPVVDAEGGLVGIVTLADLAREAAGELALPRPSISEGEVGDTLAAICQPRGPHLNACRT
jgi:CBS domain-containing protein